MRKKRDTLAKQHNNSYFLHEARVLCRFPMATIGKFIIVGAANTLVDLAVLNFLVFLFGTGPHGEWYVLFKGESFVCAVIQSYVLNKIWVFQSRRTGAKEPLLFLVVSCVGFLLNVGVSYAVFLFLSQTSSFAEHGAVTAGAIVGSVVVLVWNFIGYKMVVFSHEA